MMKQSRGDQIKESFLPRVYKLIRRICGWLDILIDNGLDQVVEVLLLRIRCPWLIVISECTFKFCALFVPHSWFVMPAIVSICHPNTFSIHIRYSFLYFLVSGCFFACFEGSEICWASSQSTSWVTYWTERIFWPARNELIKGNCDGSLELNDCRKYDIFLFQPS